MVKAMDFGAGASLSHGRGIITPLREGGGTWQGGIGARDSAPRRLRTTVGIGEGASFSGSLDPLTLPRDGGRMWCILANVLH